MSSPQKLLHGVLIATATIASPAVHAQAYPSKTIRIVTTGVGGAGDITARMMAQSLSPVLGQQIIVENRPNMQGEVVAKSPPDGYTLCLSGGNLWLTPLLQKMPYDPIKDFAPITMTDRDALIVVVHVSVPVKSIKELIALAKAKPGELNYASTGPGSTTHLATELFKSMAGVNIVHVPYKGTGATITALMSGEVPLLFGSPPPLTPHIKAGRLRALAVTTAEPSALAPGLPTVSAAGVPGYSAVGITAVFAPARTLGPIITRLNEEMVRFLNRPEVKENFFSRGSEAVPSTPEQLAAAVTLDTQRMGKLIKDLGLRND